MMDLVSTIGPVIKILLLTESNKFHGGDVMITGHNHMTLELS